MAPSFFLVTTPGYTASKWLAHVLDGHPGVSCTHSGAYLAHGLDRDYTLAELDEVVVQKRTMRAAVPLDDYFARLTAAPGHRCYGNVHLFTARGLVRHARRFRPVTPFAAVNVVRHPVPWVASGARQLSRMSAGVEVTRLSLSLAVAEMRELHADLVAAHRLDVTRSDVAAFLFMCRALVDVVDDALAAPLPIVRMEDLTTSPEHLAALVETLGSGAITPDADYLAEAVQRGALHRHRAASLSPEEELGAWQPWQRDAFAQWAARCRLWEVYATYGYTL